MEYFGFTVLQGPWRGLGLAVEMKEVNSRGFRGFKYRGNRDWCFFWSRSRDHDVISRPRTKSTSFWPGIVGGEWEGSVGVGSRIGWLEGSGLEGFGWREGKRPVHQLTPGH